MIKFAFFSIYLALVFAIFSLLFYLYGLKKGKEYYIESGKRASLAVAGIIIIDSIIMLIALGTSNFTVWYVANYTNRALPLLYKLSAFWAGNGGSLLFWELTLSIFTVIAIYNRKLKKTPLLPYVGIVLAVNSIFFLVTIGFVDNPFTILENQVIDGKGLNPLLQNPGMILHPMALYLGYVGFAVPFAYAVAALFVKDINNDFWIRQTRRWSVIAWLNLGAGILIGGIWAYEELGWGGIWMWDPVENASLLPWLTATAFIHSVMMQERRNMLKLWNIILIFMTYLLTLFGTFLVRSGVLTSVHAFGDSAIGSYFLVFIIIVSLFSVFLISTRYKYIKRNSGELESLISKEGSFLLNNLLFIGLFFSTFLGTIFPLLSELIINRKVTVGSPFFNQVNGPILLSLIVLMGICPLLAWQNSNKNNLRYNIIVPVLSGLLSLIILYIFKIRNTLALISIPIIVFVITTHIIEVIRDTLTRKKMTGEKLLLALSRLLTRNRRRYGGYLAHIGIAVIALGFIGYTQFTIKQTITLMQNETVEMGNYSFTYTDLKEKRINGMDIVYAEVNLSMADKFIRTMKPERVFYSYWPNMSTTEVSIESNLKRDVYLVLASWEKDGRATFEIKIIYLVKLIWTGGLMLLAGTIFAVWFGRFGDKTPRYYLRKEKPDA